MYTSKALQLECQAKGLRLAKLGKLGWSIESDRLKLYTSGYSRTLAGIKEKIDRLTPTEVGKEFPNGNGMYEEGWLIYY